MSNISNRSDCHCPSRIEQRRRIAALCHLDDPLREQLAARSLETIHFGPEYCGRALSRREGGKWGDGNECTGDEASYAENDLKQLMADVARAAEKAQEAVARITSKAATATTETESTTSSRSRLTSASF